MKKLYLAATVYGQWDEKNNRIFKNSRSCHDTVLNSFLTTVKLRLFSPVVVVVYPFLCNQVQILISVNESSIISHVKTKYVYY